MRQLSIKARLLALFALMAGMLVLAVYANLARQRQSSDAMHALYTERIVALRRLKLVSDAYTLRVGDAARKAVNGNLDSQPALQLFDAARHEAKAAWQDYLAGLQQDDEKQLAMQVQAGMQAAEPRLAELREALAGDRLVALRDLADQPLDAAVRPVGAGIDRLIALQLDDAERRDRVEREGYESARLRNIVISAVVLGLLAVLGRNILASIVAPLRRAVQMAEQVAAGDLRLAEGPVSADEPGQLIAALRRMAAQLAGLVAGVRDGSEGVATGSREIAGGNADLSQRTEHQAGDLQQTAASMEALTAQIRVNASTAQLAAQASTDAAGVAEQGGSAVGLLVQTMEAIAVASKRIADIIGVIDGIAFQTNILALNAAVEAARAGEQGRGFAVVAGEVRALAQRAAEAAREIRALIAASGETIADGSRHAADAGRTMAAVVEEARRVGSLIAEISGSSQAQARGVDLIAAAVARIDQSTQQNAALVEQSAAAAESLKQQAQRLHQAVAAFRLD